jgi:hypothetical protein
MANRIFTVAKRSDVDGMGIYFDDLHPNTSQKSSTYDGVGQRHGQVVGGLTSVVYTGEGGSHYLRHFSKDAAAHTAALVNIGGGAGAPLVDETVTAGGNDVTRTTTVGLGLLSYLRERVHVNPGADDDFMLAAEALNVANDIYARVIAGSSLTLADINVLLNARCPGADTDLGGNALSGSTSFGSVDDILRILAGEVYTTPINTILADQAGNWLGSASRLALIAPATAFVPVVQGSSSLTTRQISTITRNGSVNISAGEGKLFGVAAATFGFTNPNFAYAAAAVTTLKPRAILLNDTIGVPAPIAATGIASAVAVYDSTGAVLAG